MEIIVGIIVVLFLLLYIPGTMRVYKLRTMIDHIINTLIWFGTKNITELSSENIKELLTQQNTPFSEKDFSIVFSSPQYTDWLFTYNTLMHSLTAYNANRDSLYFGIRIQLYNDRIQAACSDTGATPLREFMYWIEKRGIPEVRPSHLQ